MMQTLINLCVVVGLLPVTGITLPLISYGGSSLVITLFSLGIIAMELYYKHNPFDPTWVGKGLGIKDNIIGGNKRIDIKNTKESRKFVNIFLKTLEVQPFNRYRKYTSFKEALENFLKEEL